MRARSFRLHDREHISVERFDGRDSGRAADLRFAARDCVDGVTTGICDRDLGEIENILDYRDMCGWTQGSVPANRIRAGSFRSDALRARMPTVSRLGDSGIAPAGDTTP